MPSSKSSSFIPYEHGESYKGKNQILIPGYDKQTGWDVPSNRRTSQPSSSGRQSSSNPPQQGSTSVFSATGHSKPSASASHSRSPQPSAPTGSHDSARGMMGSGSGAGANFQGFQSGDPYGREYPSSQGYPGQQGLGCNAHAGLPTFTVVQCDCGSRLAYSNGQFVAVLQEGGNAMMGGMPAAHASGQPQWPAGQSSSSSSYTLNQWSGYN
ncbi:hypothetical protein SCHPADRAFT_483564 [Schizopora paradoxa]|uniref:Uncharacterized protein n=1 Tax=Schizopora paradoxa TaxID=27342 RepID=A0A0H2S2B7_9AGAM|nr:hypothetical protein SCHPADRAFT_483564 [Schizopora paradoxa]